MPTASSRTTSSAMSSAASPSDVTTTCWIVDTRLERGGDEMASVEQCQQSVVALRDRAKARDDGVLAAGDALHDRVFDAARDVQSRL